MCSSSQSSDSMSDSDSDGNQGWMLGTNGMAGDDHISFSYSSDEDFIPGIMKKKEKRTHSEMKHRSPSRKRPSSPASKTEDARHAQHSEQFKASSLQRRFENRKKEDVLSLEQKRRRLSSMNSTRLPSTSIPATRPLITSPVDRGVLSTRNLEVGDERGKLEAPAAVKAQDSSNLSSLSSSDDSDTNMEKSVAQRLSPPPSSLLSHSPSPATSVFHSKDSTTTGKALPDSDVSSGENTTQPTTKTQNGHFTTSSSSESSDSESDDWEPKFMKRKKKKKIPRSEKADVSKSGKMSTKRPGVFNSSSSESGDSEPDRRRRPSPLHTSISPRKQKENYHHDNQPNKLLPSKDLAAKTSVNMRQPSPKPVQEKNSERRDDAKVLMKRGNDMSRSEDQKVLKSSEKLSQEDKDPSRKRPAEKSSHPQTQDASPAKKLRLVDIDFTGGKMKNFLGLPSKPSSKPLSSKASLMKKLKIQSSHKYHHTPGKHHLLHGNGPRSQSTQKHQRDKEDPPRVVSSSATNVLKAAPPLLGKNGRISVHQNLAQGRTAGKQAGSNSNQITPAVSVNTASSESDMSRVEAAHTDLFAQKDAILAAKFPQKRKLVSEQGSSPHQPSLHTHSHTPSHTPHKTTERVERTLKHTTVPHHRL